jgi:hypothetical protein
MDEQANLGPGGYGPPPGGGGYGPPPGGYGPPPGGGGYGGPPPGGYGAPPPGGFGGGPPPFGPPGMPGPMGPGFGPPNASTGLAVGALVSGIIAIPTTCCCSILSLPLAVAAVIMGGVALSKAKAQPHLYGGKGMAVAGLICGAVAIVMAIAALALGMGQALVDYSRTH